MSLILLDAPLIQKYMHSNIPLHIEIFQSIDSTNNYLKQNKSDGTFRICLAEHQTAGRGRFGRSWIAPFAANICLSCAWNTSKSIHELGGLSLKMGLAIVQGLSEFGIKEGLMIKWPNDIFWQGKKLAGILTEINAVTHQPLQIILGIGINVNMPSQTEEQIDQPWASINHILGEDQDRNKIVGLLLNYIIHAIEAFEKNGFSESDMQLWKLYDYRFRKTISLKVGSHCVTGVAMGVNSLGHLLLQQDNEEIVAYPSGDIFVT